MHSLCLYACHSLHVHLMVRGGEALHLNGAFVQVRFDADAGLTNSQRSGVYDPPSI